MPSIGVGKTVFAVDGITEQKVIRQCERDLNKAGDVIELVGRSGKVWGAALKSTDKADEPIIIS